MGQASRHIIIILTQEFRYMLLDECSLLCRTYPKIYTNRIDTLGTGDHVQVPLRKELMAPLVGCWRILASLLSLELGMLLKTQRVGCRWGACAVLNKHSLNTSHVPCTVWIQRKTPFMKPTDSLHRDVHLNKQIHTRK